MVQVQLQSPSPASPPNYVGAPLTPDIAGVHQRRVFPIATDPMQGDKASEIKLLSFARPHMRAFHFAWLSFFIAFFGWWSIPPMMPTIQKQLGITTEEIYNTNIAAVSSTIVGRVIAGPLCDRYGSRTVQTVLLILGSVPVACAAFVTSYTGLLIVRLFIGFVGCTFIGTAYWTSTMFTKQVVGSANALAAGWGNLGAGVTTLITPQIFNLVTTGGAISDDMGWRITLVIPAAFMIVVGLFMYKYSDDCPHGNYADLKKNVPEFDLAEKQPQKDDVKQGLWAVCKMPVTWILAFQYACSFGVELQVHNVLTLFYYNDFTRADCDPATDATACRRLTQSHATLISSLFGLMCIFARAMGGYASDAASGRWEMKGRIVIQFICFAGQAVSLYFFSQAKSLAASVPLLVLFGIFVQACTGSTYGIVPYVYPKYTGATSGMVGAGGNLGALCWAIMFKEVGARDKSFKYLSYFVAAATVATLGIQVEGERTLWGKDDSVHGSKAATECDDDMLEKNLA